MLSGKLLKKEKLINKPPIINGTKANKKLLKNQNPQDFPVDFSDDNFFRKDGVKTRQNLDHTPISTDFFAEFCFFTTFLTGVLLATVFFAETAFLVTVFLVGAFLTEVFLVTVFLVVVFFTTFLAVVFLGAAFFATFLVVVFFSALGKLLKKSRQF
jgi:hypothetical protein